MKSAFVSALFVLVTAFTPAYAGGLASSSDNQIYLLDRDGVRLPIATADLISAMDARMDSLKVPTRTTMEANLLPILRREIQATGNKFSALQGAALLMNVNTGEIIAAVSETMAGEPSYFLSRSFEPGATMMVLTVAASLAAEAISATDMFDVSKPILAGDYIFDDYYRHRGEMRATDILQESSNIGAVRIGLKLGYARYRNFLAKIGLATIPRQSGGSLDMKQSIAMLSYGASVRVFPARLAAAFATITNGGRKVSPTFLPNKIPIREQIIAEKHSATMRDYLRNAVRSGTGNKSDHNNVLIGGKTSTVDKPKGQVISSFIAVFPINEPRYALYVAFDEPQGIEETFGFANGGWVAAPAACKIISAAAAHLDLSIAESSRCPN